MSSLRKGGGHTLLGNALFERGNHRKPAFTKGGKKKKHLSLQMPFCSQNDCIRIATKSEY